MEGKFEIKDETLGLRNELADELVKESASKKAIGEIEKFRKGIFFVPGKTLKTISELIDNVKEAERHSLLQQKYNQILEKV